MTVSTDANLAVAGGTIILAFFTWRAAAASRKAAQATEQAASSGREAAEASRQAAEAARKEADATIQLAQEAREDRELAWRPHLGIEVPTDSNGPDRDLVEATITNVGNGPALDCTFWTYRGQMESSTYRWGKRSGFQLAAGQAKALDQVARDPPGVAPVCPEDLFALPSGDSHRSHVVHVVTCTDLLGNTWRFVHGHRPVMVRADDPSPPQWMKYL